jgi:hypothetical protein
MVGGPGRRRDTVRVVPESSSPEQMQEAVVLSVPLRPVDVARLDQSADRRGATREELVVEAVDAFLAREMWSGGFIAPPPPMEVPGKFPWRPTAFRLRRRD